MKVSAEDFLFLQSFVSNQMHFPRNVNNYA